MNAVGRSIGSLLSSYSGAVWQIEKRFVDVTRSSTFVEPRSFSRGVHQERDFWAFTRLTYDCQSWRNVHITLG